MAGSLARRGLSALKKVNICWGVNIVNIMGGIFWKVRGAGDGNLKGSHLFLVPLPGALPLPPLQYAPLHPPGG